jgi:hypothetical protein
VIQICSFKYIISNVQFSKEKCIQSFGGRPEESLFVDLDIGGRITKMDYKEAGSIAWTEFISTGIICEHSNEPSGFMQGIS